MPAIIFARLLALNHTSMSPMADSAIVDIKELESCRAIMSCGYQSDQDWVKNSLRYQSDQDWVKNSLRYRKVQNG